MSEPRVTWVCRTCGGDNGLEALFCGRCAAERPVRGGEPIRPPQPPPQLIDLDEEAPLKPDGIISRLLAAAERRGVLNERERIARLLETDWIDDVADTRRLARLIRESE